MHSVQQIFIVALAVWDIKEKRTRAGLALAF